MVLLFLNIIAENRRHDDHQSDLYVTYTNASAVIALIKISGTAKSSILGRSDAEMTVSSLENGF